MREKNKQAGFTLIELLMVVLIIGLLASIAIPVFVRQRDIAKDNVAMANLTNAYLSVKQQFYANGEKWPTAAVMAAQAASDEPTYTYQNYNGGVAPSTGPKNMSISVEDNDMMTMCAQATTAYVYCLRADSQYNLLASTQTNLSHDPNGNLLASFDPTGLIDPPVANALTTDYKGVARSTGDTESAARAALPTRTSGSNASSASGWSSSTTWSYCTGTCSGSPDKPNLIRDPSFSDISTNWNLYCGAPGCTITPSVRAGGGSDPVGGSPVWVVQNTAPASQPAWSYINGGLRGTDMVAGKSYTTSYYIRLISGTAPSFAPAGVMGGNALNTVIPNGSGTTVTNSWQKISQTHTAAIDGLSTSVFYVYIPTPGMNSSWKVEIQGAQVTEN